MGKYGHTLTLGRDSHQLFPVGIPSHKMELIVRAIGGVILYDSEHDMHELINDYLFKPNGRKGRRKVGGYRVYIPSKGEVTIIHQFIVRRIMKE